MEYISNNSEETEQIAKEVLESLSPTSEATVLALEGDLGSGKTTFSQFLGQALGVEEPMQSPTFLIQKIYNLKGGKWKRLVHIDTYRLDKPEEEILYLGWDELIKDPETLVIMEWADRARRILPKSAIHIVFHHAEDSQNSKRRIEISSL